MKRSQFLNRVRSKRDAGRVLRPSAAGFTRALHKFLIAGVVHGERALLRHHLRQVNWKAHGVVQAKRVLRAHHAARGARRLGRHFKKFNATLQCFSKRNFLVANNVGDAFLLRA